MRKFNILGKQVPAMFLALLVFVGLGGASILTYYGQITATVEVEQSIVLSGSTQSTFGVTGSEIGYSAEANIVSNTVNDLDVNFGNICDPDCIGITITNMVELSIKGAQGAIDPFENQYYKTSDYLSPVSSLSGINDVIYSFKITYNTMPDTLAPYIVIVGEGIGDYDVAVQMIPDGETYNTDTPYTKTIDDATFHVPGPGSCTQQTPCTLAEIKATYPTADVSKIRLALGAWTGTDDTTQIDILMGIGTINGEQVEHKYLTVYGETTIPTIQKYEFAPDINPGTYIITTNIAPV